MKELLLVLLFLIWRLQDLPSSCPKWQELFWTFFPKLGDSRTLPAPAQNEMQILVHAGAPLALVFLIARLQDLIRPCSKLFVILIWSQLVPRDYLFQKEENMKNLAWVKLFSLPYLIRGIAGSYRFTLKLKIIKWNAENRSCRNSFGPSFPNCEIIRPYQLLLKIIWNNTFLN